ncbi:MAG: response regulator [Candidatus Saccharibacteria bacterium]
MVEDDDALANVYTMRLKGEGFDVRRVANGEDALAAAKEHKPDMVLLDAMMPKVSGFDVLDIPPQHSRNCQPQDHHADRPQPGKRQAARTGPRRR